MVKNNISTDAAFKEALRTELGIPGGFPAGIVSPDGTRRLKFRNGTFAVEATLTPTGFAGVENVDWELISNF